MSKRREKPAQAYPLGELGAEPVVCDVYDAEALREAVAAFGPEAVMHQLTDLPDDASKIEEFAPRSDRIRRDETRAGSAVDRRERARVGRLQLLPGGLDLAGRVAQRQVAGQARGD